MDNQDESSVIQLIEAVMWYVDKHVEDAGTADNINCALHGIVHMIGGTIEEPPRYKQMRENAHKIDKLKETAMRSTFNLEAFTPIRPNEDGSFTCPYCGVKFRDFESHICWVNRK